MTTSSSEILSILFVTIDTGHRVRSVTVGALEDETHVRSRVRALENIQVSDVKSRLI